LGRKKEKSAGNRDPFTMGIRVDEANEVGVWVMWNLTKEKTTQKDSYSNKEGKDSKSRESPTTQWQGKNYAK